MMTDLMVPILSTTLSLGLSFSFVSQKENRQATQYYELSKYSSNAVVLPEEYRRGLISQIELELRTIESQMQTSDIHTCVTKINVGFLNNNKYETPIEVRDFEQGMLKVDMTLCFERTTPKAVVDLANSDQFQKSSISTIREITHRDQMTCHKTRVLSVGSSHYCFMSEHISQDDFASTMTYNTWNEESSRYDAPVYFRQIMTSAKSLASGQVAFRSITYVRGPDLGSFQKSMSKRVILSEQTQVYEKMKEELSRR